MWGNTRQTQIERHYKIVTRTLQKKSINKRQTEDLFQIKGDEIGRELNAMCDLKISFASKDIIRTTGKICTRSVAKHWYGQSNWFLINALWLWKRTSLFLRNMHWKALKCKRQHVCHSEMGQEKHQYIATGRKKNKEDVVKYQHLGNMVKGIYKFFALLFQLLSLKLSKLKVKRKNNKSMGSMD